MSAMRLPASHHLSDAQCFTSLLEAARPTMSMPRGWQDLSSVLLGIPKPGGELQMLGKPDGKH